MCLVPPDVYPTAVKLPPFAVIRAVTNTGTSGYRRCTGGSIGSRSAAEEGRALVDEPAALFYAFASAYTHAGQYCGAPLGCGPGIGVN